MFHRREIESGWHTAGMRGVEKVSASGFKHVTFIAGQFRLQLKHHQAQTVTSRRLKGFWREGVK